MNYLGRELHIDIETLSLRPDAYVVQVGIALIDTDNLRLISPPYGYRVDMGSMKRHVDLDTVSWWMNQSTDIRERVFGHHLPVITPYDLAQHIQQVMASREGEHGEQTYWTIWANPAMFDLRILLDLWDNVRPWGNFRKEKCLMTFASEIDPEGIVRSHVPNPAKHDAVADAEHQALYRLALLKRISGRGLPVRAAA